MFEEMHWPLTKSRPLYSGFANQELPILVDRLLTLFPQDKVNGLTVDLSYLLSARGISTAAERTEFTWMYKRNEAAAHRLFY